MPFFGIKLGWHDFFFLEQAWGVFYITLFPPPDQTHTGSGRLHWHSSNLRAVCHWKVFKRASYSAIDNASASHRAESLSRPALHVQGTARQVLVGCSSCWVSEAGNSRRKKNKVLGAFAYSFCSFYSVLLPLHPSTHGPDHYITFQLLPPAGLHHNTNATNDCSTWIDNLNFFS
jgi:hypothetical protein